MIKHISKKIIIFLAAAVMLFVMIAAALFCDIGSVSALYVEGEMKVHFVDVGQGDCVIIELPDGKNMLIDAGENKKSTESAISNFITNNLGDNFKYFDYAVLTHPDSDHCGSLDYVLGKYPAKVVYRPNVEATGTKSKPYTDPAKAEIGGIKTKDTAAYADAVKAMYYTGADFTTVVYLTDPENEEQSIRGGAGDGEYAFTFFSPLSDVYSDWNNYSPIMLLQYRGFKFALSGDAEKENEAEFVEKVKNAPKDGVDDKYDIFTDTFNVDVLKAGHHGSETSTSKAYLDIMTTEIGAKSAYYIFSCGEGNSYGHPHAEVLDRITGMGVPQDKLLRTDIVGDISFTVKSENGEYVLVYGETSAKPTDPDTPLPKKPQGGGTTTTPEPENQSAPDGEKKDDKFWIIVTIIIVVIIIVAAIIIIGERNKRKRGKNGGRGKGKRK